MLPAWHFYMGDTLDLMDATLNVAEKRAYCLSWSQIHSSLSCKLQLKLEDKRKYYIKINNYRYKMRKNHNMYIYIYIYIYIYL